MTTDWKLRDQQTILDAILADPPAGSGPLRAEICKHSLRARSDIAPKVGGGGVVIPCEETIVPGVFYALKVARPSLFTGRRASEREYRKAEQEYRTHLPLSHINVAKMFGLDHVNIDAHRYPCTLIEWVPDAQPFDEYVSGVTDPYTFASVFHQACDALQHLHMSGVVHWDVKSDNLLVSDRGVVKLMDLGNTRRLNLDPEALYTRKSEKAQSTDRNLPPDLHARLPHGSLTASTAARRIAVSLNRVTIPLQKGETVWDHPALDLYMLAREINRLFGFDSIVTALDPPDLRASPDAVAELRDRIFSGEDGAFFLEYFRTIVTRLLAAGSPRVLPAYIDAGAVAAALRRLEPEYGEATDVPELQPVPQHVLRLPPSDNVPWSDRVRSLMNAAPLRRLHLHRQLATVVHVFPGAEHTRWEHALGTFNQTLRHIRALYADRSDVRFRLDTTKVDVTALMFASLLHDIGHPAFGHQLEESPLVSWAYRHEKYAIDVIDACIDPDQAVGAVADDAPEIRRVAEEHWCGPGVALEDLLRRVQQLLYTSYDPESRAPHTEGGAEPEPELSVHRDRRVHAEILAAILAGDLDSDKTDYLIRDAHHCGVEYPHGIDRNRLDQALTTHVHRAEEDDREHGRLGVTWKGILPVESLVIARYQMFRAVYWQHTVRALTVMLQELVEAAVVSGRDDVPSNIRISESALDEVVSVFRSSRDEDALAWLAGRVPTNMSGLVRGLGGDRAEIFWVQAEFRGEYTLPRDAAIYEHLIAEWTPKPPDGRAGGGRAATAEASIRRTIGSRLALKRSIVESFNAKNATRSSAYLGLHEVLLDVPVRDKDAGRDIFAFVNEQGRFRVEPLRSLTPLAEAAAQAFDSSVRPARVFVHPPAVRRISVALGVSEAEVGARVGAAVDAAIPQQPLPVTG